MQRVVSILKNVTNVTDSSQLCIDKEVDNLNAEGWIVVQVQTTSFAAPISFTVVFTLLLERK